MLHSLTLIDSSYWTREPTGEEWVVEAILGINHGGLGRRRLFLGITLLKLPAFLTSGVVSWNDPTPDDIVRISNPILL